MQTQNQRQIEELNEAMNMIEEAKQIVENVVNERHDSAHWDAYLTQQFKTLLGNGNPYDQSVPKLIEQLSSEGDNSERCPGCGGGPETCRCEGEQDAAMSVSFEERMADAKAYDKGFDPK